MIEIISSFKERFNEALSIRNIKPIELSEKTGISESTISQYRSGYAKPKDDKLVVLSNALDVNPVWLMGLNVPMELQKPEPVNVSIDIDYDTDKIAEAISLFNIYQNAPKDLQQGIDALLRLAQTVSQTAQSVPQQEVVEESQKHRAVSAHPQKDKK